MTNWYKKARRSQFDNLSRTLLKIVFDKITSFLRSKEKRNEILENLDFETNFRNVKSNYGKLLKEKMIKESNYELMNQYLFVLN